MSTGSATGISRASVFGESRITNCTVMVAFFQSRAIERPAAPYRCNNFDNSATEVSGLVEVVAERTARLFAISLAVPPKEGDRPYRATDPCSTWRTPSRAPPAHGTRR